MARYFKENGSTLSKHMKLLIITPIYPPDIGGPATYVSNLMKYLPKNIETSVITFSQKSCKQKKLTRISYKQNFIKRQWWLFQAVWQKAKNIDLIYIQGALTVGLVGMLTARLKNKSYLVKYVGDEIWEKYQSQDGQLNLKDFLKQKPGFSNKIKIFGQKIILQNAKTIIVPGKYLHNILKKYYKLKNVAVIPNAVTKKDLRIKKKKNTIIYVGRLAVWKNVDQIIKALVILKKQNHFNWQLLIIGDGSQKQKLKTIVKKLKLDNVVKFTGKLSHDKTLVKIAEAEYLVLYSAYEGLSHVLLEGMFCKTKIIASDILANKNLLQNGQLGKLVKLNSPKKLAHVLLEPYSLAMINQAYQQVIKNYSWSGHTQELIKIFNA